MGYFKGSIPIPKFDFGYIVEVSPSDHFKFPTFWSKIDAVRVEYEAAFAPKITYRIGGNWYEEKCIKGVMRMEPMP